MSGARFALLDTETTGFEPGDHRMVEIYIALHDDKGTKLYAYEKRLDPQRSIPIETTRVHGITASMVAGALTWEAVAPDVWKILNSATCFVAHNAEFDLRFLRYELKRVGLALPERPVIDTMADGIWASPDGKKPTLAELCFACGIPYDPVLAHAAAYDVDVMKDCLFKARKWGYFKNPEVQPEQVAA